MTFGDDIYLYVIKRATPLSFILGQVIEHDVAVVTTMVLYFILRIYFSQQYKKAVLSKTNSHFD